MTTLRSRFTVCGALLIAFPIFSAYGLAQGGTRLVTLHSFTGPDGEGPDAAVAIGNGGVLYGTTSLAGSGAGGTVFSLTPPASEGGAWTAALLYAFGSATGDGAFPGPARLSIGGGGVLYGTTPYGGIAPGISGYGTVFSLTPPAFQGGAWTEAVLYRFTRGADGGYPDAGVAIGEGGVLYGTTSQGGIVNASCNDGCGTVFSLAPPAGGPSGSGAWTEAVLYSFAGGDSDGLGPFGELVIGGRGVLYGTTPFGGNTNCGTVFSLTPPRGPSGSGGVWTEKVLYNFTGGIDGANPYPGVTVGSGGVLYGATLYGGLGLCNQGLGCGTVFSLTQAAGGASGSGPAWTEAVLYAFTGGADGDGPWAPSVGEGGVLYGTTQAGGTTENCSQEGCGTVFSLSPPTTASGAWVEAVLSRFPGRGDDGQPLGLAIGKEGMLYGTTYFGGAAGDGSVFSLRP
jgi:uncharacterized repeat protein (TIGR03803 family)